MREVGTLIGGAGLLIFAYLVIANAGPAGTIVTSVSGAAVNLIGALQGKSASGLTIG